MHFPVFKVALIFKKMKTLSHEGYEADWKYRQAR
jgi:hypothetical protein